MENNDAVIRQRFQELLDEIEVIPKKMGDYGWYISEFNELEFRKWLTSARYLLKSVFGEESLFFKDWETLGNQHSNKTPEARSCLAIIQSAKENYEKGYIFDQKALIEANLLGSALQQAEDLFSNKYLQAAAIVAGVALETHLKSLCEQKAIVITEANPGIQAYNQGLYKAKVYSQPQMQEIATWGSIRNAAAHGNWGEFTKDHIDMMIKGVTRFLNTKY